MANYLYETTIEGINYELQSQVRWCEAREQFVEIALGENGIYKLYYDEPDGEYKLEDIDYDNPDDIENITEDYDLDVDDCEVTGKLERVEDGLIDFVASALREYDDEYVQPVQIGYTWMTDELVATHIFIDGKPFKNGKGDDIYCEPETIEL